MLPDCRAAADQIRSTTMQVPRNADVLRMCSEHLLPQTGFGCSRPAASREDAHLGGSLTASHRLRAGRISRACEGPKSVGIPILRVIAVASLLSSRRRP